MQACSCSPVPAASSQRISHVMRQPRGGSSNSLSAVHKELIPDVLPVHQLCFHTGRSSSRRRRECCCGSSKQPFCGSRRRCVGGRGGFVCVTCAPKGPGGQQAGGAGLAGRWGWRGRGRGLVGVFGAGAGIVVGVCPGRLHPVRLHGPLALDLPQQQCRRRRTKSHGGREGWPWRGGKRRLRSLRRGSATWRRV